MSIADFPDWSSQGSVPTFLVPNSSGLGGGGTVVVKILEPPADGHYYVYGFDIALDDGDAPTLWTLYDDAVGYPIAVGYASAAHAEHVVIAGEKILGNLKLQSHETITSYCVRNNIGP